MSDAALRTDGSLEAQPKMGVRSLHDFTGSRWWLGSTKVIHAQPASLNDAFECADGNGRSNRREEAPSLASQPPTLNSQPLSHSLVTSAATKCGGDGSNQSASASFALAIASSSVSPAEAQPGSSGKKAAQRFVSGSCSTTSRNFMASNITPPSPSGNLAS